MENELRDVYREENSRRRNMAETNQNPHVDGGVKCTVVPWEAEAGMSL